MLGLVSFESFKIAIKIRTQRRPTLDFFRSEKGMSVFLFWGIAKPDKQGGGRIQEFKISRIQDFKNSR